MKRLHVILMALLLATGCATNVDWGSYDPVSLDSMTPEAWQSDLDTMSTELRRLHGSTLYHATTRSGFESALETARATALTASNDEMIAEVYRLLATLGEGHTSVNASPDLYYPIVLRWFPEGVYVVRAEATREEILGQRVLTVGGLAPAELETRIDPLISVDVPEGLPVARPSLVMNTRLMRGLGIAGEDGLVVELEGSGAVTIQPLGPEDTFTGKSYLETLDPDTLPVSLRPRGESYWYDLDPASGLLYVRYDTCTSDAAGMFNEVLDHLGGGQVQRLVLDLRWNGGGSSRPGTDFAEAVADIASINTPGSLYVLIGPRTFSSAMMNAMDFRARTEAIFAGEPLVEPAGHYGEVRRFELPASGLVIGTSTRYFDYGLGVVPAGQDSSTWVLSPTPGWEHTWTWAEYGAGTDPVLESVSLGL